MTPFNCLALAVFLFCAGLFGAVTRTDAPRTLLALGVMLCGCWLALAALGGTFASGLILLSIPAFCALGALMLANSGASAPRAKRKTHD
ncbi:MAG: hypothetical protein WCS77_02920 [Elusimicrobiaceae bacterium]